MKYKISYENINKIIDASGGSRRVRRPPRTALPLQRTEQDVRDIINARPSFQGPILNFFLEQNNFPLTSTGLSNFLDEQGITGTRNIDDRLFEFFAQRIQVNQIFDGTPVISSGADNRSSIITKLQLIINAIITANAGDNDIFDNNFFPILPRPQPTNVRGLLFHLMRINNPLITGARLTFLDPTFYPELGPYRNPSRLTRNPTQLPTLPTRRLLTIDDFYNVLNASNPNQLDNTLIRHYYAVFAIINEILYLERNPNSSRIDYNQNITPPVYLQQTPAATAQAAAPAPPPPPAPAPASATGTGTVPPAPVPPPPPPPPAAIVPASATGTGTVPAPAPIVPPPPPPPPVIVPPASIVTAPIAPTSSPPIKMELNEEYNDEEYKKIRSQVDTELKILDLQVKNFKKGGIGYSKFLNILFNKNYLITGNTIIKNSSRTSLYDYLLQTVLINNGFKKISNGNTISYIMPPYY